MYYNFKKFVIRDDSDLDETLDLNEDYNSEIAICLEDSEDLESNS